MTPKEKQALREKWETAVGGVIGAARLVTVFDGTDRQSLDWLSNALFELGIVELEVEQMFKDA